MKNTEKIKYFIFRIIDKAEEPIPTSKISKKVIKVYGWIEYKTTQTLVYELYEDGKITFLKKSSKTGEKYRKYKYWYAIDRWEDDYDDLDDWVIPGGDIND